MSQRPLPTDVKPNRLLAAIWIILAIVCLAVLGAVGLFSWGIYSSLQAERNLQATWLGSVILAEYVTQFGRWPASVDDLAKVEASNPSIMFTWPKDKEETLARVKFDFNLTVRKVATDSRLASQAAVPRGICYTGSDDFAHILTTACTMRLFSRAPLP